MISRILFALVFLVVFMPCVCPAEDKQDNPPATVAVEEFSQFESEFAEVMPAAKSQGPRSRATAAPTASPAATSGSFSDAMKFYDEGRLDEAQAIFQRIAQENPVDTESRRYLKSILSMKRKRAAYDQHTVQRQRILDVRRSWLPIVQPQQKGSEGGEADSKLAREKWMQEKLNTVIPEINFTDARLQDVIAYLAKVSGINIILDEDASGAGQEYPEEIEPQEQPAQQENQPSLTPDISAGVTIALKDVPLKDALKYILAPRGLKYRVDEYAVVIAAPEKLEGTDMETRYYHLASGSGTFVNVRRSKRSGKTGQEEKDKTLTIKEVLEQSGVPFPSGSKIFLDPRTSTLLVRNTPGNLAVIEKIIGALDVTPMQVAIEAKFVEIEELTARELGLEFFLRNNFPLTTSRGDPNLLISSQAGNSSAGQFTSSTVSRQGFTRGLRFLEDSSGNPTGNIFSFASVLTQPQLQVILHALDQTGMANVLSAPKVTAANNEQARIEVVTELFYPTEFEITPATTNDQGSVVTPPVVIPGGFTSRDVGITLEVTPSVGSDKKTISLTLIPEVSTLSGWQNFGISVGSNFPATPILQPVFTSKNVTASIVINDTETVVLGGLIKDTTTTQADKIPILGDLPFIGGPFRSNTESSTKTNLMIFVTAYLLTPEGETVAGLDIGKTKIFNP